MAKSGFWLRGAKGKLAGTAFYQSNGATIQREIVTPKNRKTNGQMTQRAKFANCIKFFKHSQQALFKFAFEDKRKQESDYNAFVRMNIKRSAVYDKELVDNPIYPAIGHNWILASGSLTPARVPSWSAIPAIELPSAPNLTHTLGELSQAFIKDYDLQTGDIVTMVFVVSDIRYSDDTPESYPKWTLIQWQIDPNSEDQLYQGRVFKDANIYNGQFRPVNSPIHTAAGFACIFSRNIEGGRLKASYAELVNNEYAQDMVDYTSATQQVINRALASWGATGDVILQGSQVINKTLAPYVEPEVTEINGEEIVPLDNVMIALGDDKEFSLSFNKTGVEIEDEDFSADVPGIVVKVVGDDAIRVTAPNTEVESFVVKYHNQTIITGVVVNTLAIDKTTITLTGSGGSFGNCPELVQLMPTEGMYWTNASVQADIALFSGMGTLQGSEEDAYWSIDSGVPGASIRLHTNGVVEIYTTTSTLAGVDVTLQTIKIGDSVYHFVEA